MNCLIDWSVHYTRQLSLQADANSSSVPFPIESERKKCHCLLDNFGREAIARVAHCFFNSTTQRNKSLLLSQRPLIKQLLIKCELRSNSMNTWKSSLPKRKTNVLKT